MNIIPLEKDIQNAICEYLEYPARGGNLFFWRQNTNPIFDRKTNSVRRMPKYSVNGVSDLIILFNKRVIFLEVKRPKAKQSIDQIKFQFHVQRHAGEYYVVSSIEEVQKIIYG